MKKSILILSVLILASCKDKQYNCVCTDNATKPIGYTITTIESKNESKAKEKCSGMNEYSYTKKTVLDTSCHCMKEVLIPTSNKSCELN